MRGCLLTSLHAVARRPRPCLHFNPATTNCSLCLALPFSAHVAEPPHKAAQVNFPDFRRYSVFERIGLPERRIDGWTALLDAALPPHLRDWDRSTSPPPVTLGASEVAEVLLAAQHDFRGSSNEGFDLLFELGIRQGRWRAVIWLIKDLVERFPARHGRPSRFDGINALWDDTTPLNERVRNSICLHPGQTKPMSSSIYARSLDEITSADHPENSSSKEFLHHDALGQIWRTLGAMTMACAGAKIRPEVLEIIAYLHHREVMPFSIYQSEQNPDKTAIQQPPLLSLLSSRILTSLSDAAWRAHEKLVVEEAKAKGGEYAALRPEVPGSVYRVQVAGLRPEVWMELILWSCIHGGWICHGADILDLIVHDDAKNQDKQWRALSWHEYEKSTAADSVTWGDWEYSFKTRAASTRDGPEGPQIQVQRTVSAEVVNAYIDAVVTTAEIGVGDRGSRVSDIVLKVRRWQRFLYRNPSRLTLGFGSWDGLCLRLIENSSVIPETDIGLLKQILRLSPGFSYGLASKNAQSLPDYVLDGNAAILGFFHRALYGEISSGSYEGAASIFKEMLQNADADKVKSLAEFMKGREGRQPLLQSLSENEMFTSNLAGIEYPAFDLQIPPTLLASLLDLATECTAYDFARWLLYNKDVDEPVIGETLYKHPQIQAAIIRFAAASNDLALMTKIGQMRPSRSSLRAILDTQFDASKWEAATRLLEHLAETPGSKWTIHNLAVAIRAMLRQVSNVNPHNAESKNQLRDATTVFAGMISRRYGGSEKRTATKKAHIHNLLLVLSAADASWAELCSPFRLAIGPERNFVLETDVFNIVLEGVVAAYGSTAGRRLLNMFCPVGARNAHDAVARLRSRKDGRRRMSRFRPSMLNSIQRQRIVVHVPKSHEQRKVVALYGALAPNTRTILIILRNSLKEIQSDSGKTLANQPATADVEALQSTGEHQSIVSTCREVIRWAVRRLAELPHVDNSIFNQIDQVLREEGLEDVRADLNAILDTAADEASAEEDSEAPNYNLEKLDAVVQ